MVFWRHSEGVEIKRGVVVEGAGAILPVSASPDALSCLPLLFFGEIGTIRRVLFALKNECFSASCAAANLSNKLGWAMWATFVA